jgi:hypothetical protein
LLYLVVILLAVNRNDLFTTNCTGVAISEYIDRCDYRFGFLLTCGLCLDICIGGELVYVLAGIKGNFN